MISAATFLVAAAAQAAVLGGTIPGTLAGRGILARQANNTLPNVPATCLPSCQPVNDELQKNCPPVECCTTTFTQNYVSCFECVATAAGITDYTSGQQTLNTLVVACNANGFPVQSVFFPGQSSTSAAPSTASLSRNTVTSLTGTPTPTISQSVVTALPGTLSLPTPSVSSPTTNTPQSGAIAARGFGVASAWVLPLVAVGMGIVLL